MKSEHPICSTEQPQVMCTEVGRNKKKCSGGGAGHIGVQDYGFYGSNCAGEPKVTSYYAALVTPKSY